MGLGDVMKVGIIPQEILDEIIQKNDIVDVVSQHVQLKKSGRNLVGLCPFHSENTPSFSVSPEKQIYHCFGCKAGGNAFNFLMNIDNLSFPEAIKNLADRVNIQLPEIEQSEENTAFNHVKQQLYDAYELAAKWYHHQLFHSEEGKLALSYLEARQFNLDTIKQFRIGYSLPSWDGLTNLLQGRNFNNLSLLERGGLLSRSDATNRYFDRFRHRIMFPICDDQGKVIAFGGRVLDQSQPKYLNSPETLLFNKSRTLYNLHIARQPIRKKQQVIVFEGYADVMAVSQRGIHNVVATLGTALTAEHAKVMRRNAEQVVLCFDSDNAGLGAALKGIDVLLAAGCIVKVAIIPDGKDPDDFIRSHGSDKFMKDVIEGALPFTAFRLLQLRREYSLSDDSEKMKYIQQALATISELPHAVERDHYLRELSTEFNLSLDALKLDQRQAFYKKANKRDITSKPWNNSINIGNDSIGVSPLLPAFHNAEKRCIALMMKFPEIVSRVHDEIGSGFHVEEYGVLAAYLYAHYAEVDTLDLNRFILIIDDPKLAELAIALAMAELPVEVNEQELQDIFKQIRDYPVKLKINHITEEIRKAERSGDSENAVRLAMERLMLEQALKNGKSHYPVEGGK